MRTFCATLKRIFTLTAKKQDPMRIFNLNSLSIIAVLILSQLLTGCAIFQPKSTTTPINQTQAAVKKLKNWQLKGKLIFKSPEEKFSASLNWAQQQQNTDIRLTTFLGISILKLKQSEQQAKLEYDGNTYQADNAAQLLAKHTNLHWPIDQMQEWIKGVSTTPGQMIQYNQNQQISQITLLDNHGNPWQLKYPQYMAVEHQGKSYQLPKQVRLQNQQMTIIIKISRWIIE